MARNYDRLIRRRERRGFAVMPAPLTLGMLLWAAPVLAQMAPPAPATPEPPQAAPAPPPMMAVKPEPKPKKHAEEKPKSAAQRTYEPAAPRAGALLPAASASSLEHENLEI